MNFSQLRDQLSPKLPANGGTFRVAATDFRTRPNLDEVTREELGIESPVEGLLDNWFPNGELVIENANTILKDFKITIRGKGALPKLHFAKTDFEAVFHIVNSTPQLTLTIDLPNGWKLPDNIAGLDNTIFENLAFSDAALLLNSYDNGVREPAKRLQHGLNFRGTLQNWQPTPELLALEIPAPRLQLHGDISFKEDKPEVLLSTWLGNGIDLGFLKIIVEPQYLATVIAPEADDTAIDAVPADEANGRLARSVGSAASMLHFDPVMLNFSRLLLRLQYMDHGKLVEIPATVSLTGSDAGQVQIIADLRDFSASFLGHLDALVNDMKLSEILPDSFALKDAFSLRFLSFTITPAQKRVDEVAFGLDCNIHLTELAAFYLPRGAALPEGIPEVGISYVGLSVAPQTGAYTFTTEAFGQFDFPFIDAEIDLDTVSFTVSHAPARRDVDVTLPAQTDFNMQIAGMTDLEIGEGFAMRQLAFSFDFEQGAGWSAAGSIGASVFGHDFELALSFAKNGQTELFTFDWQAPQAIEVLDLEGVANLALSHLSLAITRQVGSQRQGAASSTDWALSGVGDFQINDLFDTSKNIFKGTCTLEFEKTAQQKRLSLQFANTSGRFDIPLAPGASNEKWTFEFKPAKVSVVQDKNTGFSFELGTGIAIHGLPKKLDEVLTDEINAAIAITNKQVDVKIDRIFEAVEIPIPDIEVGGDRIKLGTMLIDASNLSATLAKEVSLSADFRLGLPSALNSIFGTDSNGKATHDIFETYDKNDLDNSTILFRLGASSRGAVNFKWQEGSVFTAIKVKDGFVNCDFGEFGAIRFKVPQFTYFANRSSFEASGGFEIVRPLSLPLTPIKALLQAAISKDAANLLPDSLPLEGIDIIDDNGDFQVSEMIKILESGTGVDLPQWINDALDGVEDIADRLPDGFKDYLDFTIPDRLFFEISVDTTGSVSFGLQTYDYDRTKGDARAKAKAAAKPLRWLSPAIVPGMIPQPGFNCISLRRLSFGPLMGGSLFQLEVDGVFEQYDIASLALSLLLPEDKKFPLPTSDELQRRIVLDDLFMIIIYETVIPIPVPIFYDVAGIEYKGIEGVGLQGHAKFPMPDAGLKTIVDLFTNLKQFFEERDFLLNPQEPPGDTDLAFTVEQTYLELPEYLGGKILGKKGRLVHISAWENVAHFLNFTKTFSINELILAIEIKYRIGSESISFFNLLEFSIDWLLTTPDEFRQGAFNQLKIKSAQKEQYLKLLPASSGAATGEEGLVAFVRTKAGIRNVIELQGGFAIAASGTMGFQTGFLLQGTVGGGVIDMELGGAVAIGAPRAGTPNERAIFMVTGHGHFDVLGHRVLQTAIEISDRGFRFIGKFDLLPASSPLQVKGQISGELGKNHFQLAGSVSTKLQGLTLVGAQAMISNDLVKVSGTWLGASAGLIIGKRNNVLTFAGTVGFAFDLHIDFGAIRKAVSGVTGGLVDMGNWQVDIHAAASVGVTISEAGFSASISASFKINNKGLSVGPFTITVAPTSLSKLKQIVAAEIKKHALSYFNTVFATVEEWLAAIGGAIEFAAAEMEKVGKALKHVYKKTAKEAAKLLKDAKFTMKQIGGALENGYKMVAKDAANALKAAGFAAKEIGEVLEDGYGLVASEAAKAMKAAGFAAKEIGNVLEDGYGLAADGAAAALKAAGFAAEEAGKVLQQGYGLAEDAAKGLLEGAGWAVEHLNPSNW
ncbi:hypothetical protein KC734_04830 [candidate division KSB1 bacterium]|nr:hypothetical protein [candidate division KSB1 bacterium]